MERTDRWIFSIIIILVFILGSVYLIEKQLYEGASVFSVFYGIFGSIILICMWEYT